MKAKDTAVRNISYHCLEYDHEQMGDIYLVACGQEKCDPGVTCGPGLRDCYHLHVIRSGKGVLKVKGKEFFPHAGQMFLLKHNEVAEYTADRKDPWDYCWVTFHGSEASVLVQALGFDGDTYCLDNTQDPDAFYEFIRRMFEKPEMNPVNPVNDLRRRGILLEFLAFAMEAVQPQKKGKIRQDRRPIDDYVRKAEDFIRYNYASIQVTDVVNFIGFTRSYFYSVFRRKTGLSIQDYLTQVRMNRARYLLKNTDLQIQDVAMQVGYEDGLYFSRMFHKLYGMSPRTYRFQKEE